MGDRTYILALRVLLLMQMPRPWSWDVLLSSPIRPSNCSPLVLLPTLLQRLLSAPRLLCLLMVELLDLPVTSDPRDCVDLQGVCSFRLCGRMATLYVDLTV